jgi:hypothetical protein
VIEFLGLALLIVGIYIGMLLERIVAKKRPQGQLQAARGVETPAPNITASRIRILDRKVHFVSLCHTGKTLYGVDDKGRLWFVDLTTGLWDMHGLPDDPDVEVQKA